QAGRHNSFRISQSKIATHQQQNPDNGHVRQLHWTVADGVSSEPAISQHQESRNSKPHSTHQRRRNVLHRDPSAEVRGTTEDIHQGESKNNHPSVPAFGFSHGLWQ